MDFLLAWQSDAVLRWGLRRLAAMAGGAGVALVLACSTYDETMLTGAGGASGAAGTGGTGG